MAFGKLWFKVPETIKVNINGKLHKGVTPKDVILKVCGELGVNGATYKSLEFTGSTIKEMSVSGRMTICNMAIEVGGKAGLCEPDKKVFEWLKGKVEVYTPIYPDSDANYRGVLNIDTTELEPQIACPDNVDNVKPICKVEDVKVNQVFIGSCTNGRLEDLEQAHRFLKGRKVAPGVRVLVVPASKSVYYEAEKRGILHDFMEAGCIVTTPSCAACFGGSIGMLAPGEVGLTTSNRNFKGRQGSPDADVYLCSALVAGASAVTGMITDPREVDS